MINLQHDIIKKYLNLPLNTSWFIIFKPSIDVVNKYGKPTDLKLKSFGSGSSMIDSPTIKGQVVPNATLEFDERNTIKLIFNMEILY